MTKVLDEYGYRIMIPREDMDAIILVDNQINPNCQTKMLLISMQSLILLTLLMRLQLSNSTSQSLIPGRQEGGKRVSTILEHNRSILKQNQ